MSEDCAPLPPASQPVLSKPAIIGIASSAGIFLLLSVWLLKRCCFKSVDHDYSAAFEHWSSGKSYASSQRNSGMSTGKSADPVPPLPPPGPFVPYPDSVPLSMPVPMEDMSRMQAFPSAQQSAQPVLDSRLPESSFSTLQSAGYPSTQTNTVNGINAPPPYSTTNVASPFASTNKFSKTSFLKSLSSPSKNASPKNPEAASWFSGRSGSRNRQSLQSNGSKQSGSTGYGSMQSGSVTSRHPHRRQESADFLLGQPIAAGRTQQRSAVSVESGSRTQATTAPLITLTRASNGTTASRKNVKVPMNDAATVNDGTIYGSSYKPGSSWQGSQPGSSVFGGRKVPLDNAPSMTSTKRDKRPFDQSTQVYGSSFRGSERGYESSSVPFGQAGPVAAGTTVYNGSERSFRTGGGSSFKGLGEKFAASSVPFGAGISGPSTYAGSSYKMGASEEGYPESTIRFDPHGGGTSIWGQSTLASRSRATDRR